MPVKIKLIFYTFILSLIFAILLPFGLLFGSKKLRDFSHKELVYKVIASHVTKQAKTESEKAISLFNYLHYHLHTPIKMRTTDVDQLHHLIRNVAWCDSQAGTLATLARKVGIDGAWVSLKGFDEVSHHSTAVLYIDGKYRMLDPWGGFLFLRQDGKIATLEDIQINHKLLKSSQFGAIKLIDHRYKLNKVLGFNRLEYYLKLYEAENPWKINALNFLGFERNIVSKIIDSYYDILGDDFLILFQELYFIIADTAPLQKARIKHLSFRFKSAINDYKNILHNKDIVKESPLLLIDYPVTSHEIITSEIMFFLGQAFWDMKNYEKSIETYNDLLKKFPENRWVGLAYFYLGNSFENLNDTEKAIEIGLAEPDIIRIIE